MHNGKHDFFDVKGGAELKIQEKVMEMKGSRTFGWKSTEPLRVSLQMRLPTYSKGRESDNAFSSSQSESHYCTTSAAAVLVCMPESRWRRKQRRGREAYACQKLDVTVITAPPSPYAVHTTTLKRHVCA